MHNGMDSIKKKKKIMNTLCILVTAGTGTQASKVVPMHTTKAWQTGARAPYILNLSTR
jgi:hypothetical protein